MNVDNVVTRVQRQFGDESGVQVTEADVIRWINDSQQEAVLQHTFLLPTSSTIATVANQQSYNIPSTCLDLKNVKYTESGAISSYALQYFNSKQMNEYLGNWEGTDYIGEPLFFTQGTDNKSIKLFPVPDHSLGTITFEFGRYPVDIVTAADAIDLPTYYHQYVVEFCLMKAFEMDEEWEAMDRKAAYVQSTLDANFARDEHFGKSAYPSIVPSSEDYL